VQAAVTEVPIGDGPQAVLVEQIHEVMQIIAEVVDRNRRILPSGVGVAAVGGAGDAAGAVGADRPHLGGGRGVEDRGVQRLRFGDEPLVSRSSSGSSSPVSATTSHPAPSGREGIASAPLVSMTRASMRESRPSQAATGKSFKSGASWA